MKKIAITGGIGSGKSIICQFFELLGVPVYYADDRAKFLINNDLQLRKEIRELLGRDAYNENGYNRAWVAKQVFGNDKFLKMINEIVHPRVFEDTEKWLKLHQDKPYILREAALINKDYFDKIITVNAPLEVRIKRIKKRDSQRSEEEIRTIISKQKTEEEFNELADYQLINDDKVLLIPQILALDNVLKTL